MTPEPEQRWRSQLTPVDLPDLRLLGAHQSVILVADDEALIRNLVTLLLQHDGYFVLSAADGHEGLELSRKYPGAIDLLITDVQMPRMNGTDLCGHLMEERPGIKVLVMSGADMSEIVSQNANMPFLPKPFDGQTLKREFGRFLAAPGPASHRPASLSTAEVITGWGTWLNLVVTPHRLHAERCNHVSALFQRQCPSEPCHWFRRTASGSTRKPLSVPN